MIAKMRAWRLPLFLLLAAGAACQQAEQDTFSKFLALGDGTGIEHPWDGAGPLPARNDWVNVEVAGYLLSESASGAGFSWTWTFTLGLAHPGIELIAVSDVTDTVARRLVEPGEGVFNGTKWLAQSDPVPVSMFHQPWLFRDGESVRVLRFSIADRDGETRILYQPVLFSHEGKRSLTAIARDELEGVSGT